MTTKHIIIGAVAFASLVLSACGPTKFLVEDGFVGGRSNKTILTPAVTVGSGSQQQTLYDFGVRICDLDANGVESNCQTTTVLSNVIAGSVY